MLLLLLLLLLGWVRVRRVERGWSVNGAPGSVGIASCEEAKVEDVCGRVELMGCRWGEVEWSGRGGGGGGVSGVWMVGEAIKSGSIEEIVEEEEGRGCEY